MEERPAHIGELHHTEVVSWGPHTLAFDENSRDKRVFFAARWLNNKKEGGPWSDIESAFIP